jgi:hypothetical protein
VSGKGEILLDNSANGRGLYNVVTGVLLAQALGLFFATLWATMHRPLYFDDAYMFLRYATNIRHGLGVSWNLDGVPTYGPTSPLWVLAVLVLSYLPLGAWKILTLGSWVCSIGAVVAMAWAVAKNAGGETFRSVWRVLPWVALPLAIGVGFAGNQATGMETMLGTLLAAVFVGCGLAWQRGAMRPEIVGVVGILLFLTRPDAAIVVVGFPVLLWLLMRGVKLTSLVILLGVFFAGVGVELAVFHAYFHTMLPLSFYMKSKHAYEGFAEVWHPELLMMTFFAACQLYLAALILFARKEDWRLIVSCVVPPLVVFAYMQTVTQIMGFNGRYYAPYFAFFVVPALLVVDRWMVRWAAGDGALWPAPKDRVRRYWVTAAMLVCFIALAAEPVDGLVRRMEGRKHYEYEPAVLDVAAKEPLPAKNWDETMADVTDLLVAPLPKGTTVAATEVGYLGERASQVNVIDLAGLNDNEIALHGFDVNALLARKPDLIWMPHTNYTYQRGEMFADPQFLEQYDVYAGAANYGLAVRKDSPVRAQIEKQMHVFWSAVYPGFAMNDYLVKSASWSGAKHLVREH